MKPIVKFNRHRIGLIYSLPLVLSILMCVGSSSSCIFKYIPDATDENDHVEFPWEAKREWNRTIRDDCECGTVAKMSAPEKPWVALIKIEWPGGKVDKPKHTYCSGSLINSKFILTAYSCFIPANFSAFDTWGPKKATDIKPANIRVWINVTYSGFNPLGNSSSSEGLSVMEIIYDKSYIVAHFSKREMVRNNVALLKLEKEIEFGEADSLVPICLNPIIPEIASGTLGKVYGWLPTPMMGGVKTGSSKALKSLMNDGLPIMDRDDCNETSFAEIAPGHICINELAGKKQLDGFGAPLVITSTSKRTLLQIGILSWNDTKAQKKNNKDYHHLFYTTVETVMPFINHFSEIHNALWCKEPERSEDFFAKNVSVREKSLEMTIAASWTWIGTTSENRKETTDCTCGMHSGAQGRIIGGVDATPHEFKWQVLLRIRVFTDERKQRIHSTVCGGTLINDRMILLAAHCVVQKSLMENKDEADSPMVDPSDIEVFANVHLRKNDPDAIKLKVHRVLSHPGYIAAQLSKPPYFDWDVALLELDEPVKFEKDKLIPICLPKSGETLKMAGKPALVTGWGLTDWQKEDSLAHSLQKIEVPLQNLSYCRKVAFEKVTDNFICAGTLDRNNDASQGDSGGPLSIIGPKPNQYYQIGIVSWAEDVEGSQNQTAAFYTDVQSVLSYIDYYSTDVGALWCPP